MAKNTPLIKVTAPAARRSCTSIRQTSAVIRHVEHVKPPTFADLESAVQRQHGEASRREDAFLKSVESHKTHHDVLSKKFDEMLKIAKENPDEPPPKRDIDFD